MTGSALTPVSQPVPPKNPLKTKTFWFAVLGAAAHAATNYKDPQTILESLSIIGAAWGVRDAISKNGNGN